MFGGSYCHVCGFVRVSFYPDNMYPFVLTECSELRRPFGGVMTCNSTGEEQACYLDCRDGYLPHVPFAKVYTCGPSTNYTWSHQFVTPEAELPQCQSEWNGQLYLSDTSSRNKGFTGLYARFTTVSFSLVWFE